MVSVKEKAVLYREGMTPIEGLVNVNNAIIELLHQTVDKTLLVSTPEAFFLFWVQKVCT